MCKISISQWVLGTRGLNMEQPPWHDNIGHENKVYKVKKALYGLKQVPREWYRRIYCYLFQDELNRCNSEPTLYTRLNKQGEILIVCLYVDELIFIGDLSIKEYEMTYLDLIECFLGIEVNQNEN